MQAYAVRTSRSVHTASLFRKHLIKSKHFYAGTDKPFYWHMFTESDVRLA